MTTFILCVVLFMFGVAWAITSITAAFFHIKLGIITEKEFDNSKNKMLYLIMLGCEGPFIFLRLLKK